MTQQSIHMMTLDQLIQLKNEAVTLLDEANHAASFLRFKLANLDESIENLRAREREIARDILDLVSKDDAKEALEGLNHGIRE